MMDKCWLLFYKNSDHDDYVEVYAKEDIAIKNMKEHYESVLKENVDEKYKVSSHCSYDMAYISAVLLTANGSVRRRNEWEWHIEEKTIQ